MKERPILFSAPMVRAILDGSKTQTRRVIKGNDAWGTHAKTAKYIKDNVFRLEGDIAINEKVFGNNVTFIDAACPYGKIGDQLWVRETWVCDDYRLQEGPYIEVDGAREELFYRADNEHPFEAPEGKFWKPSIHMPRWASRIQLEITGVRVERLQDISRGDAMAEGCPFPNIARGQNPVRWYADLWTSINGAGSWEANPYVWIISFRRLKP